MPENSVRIRDPAKRAFGKKLIEAAEWAMDYLPMCGYCRKKSKEKKQPPPCATCRIDSLDENVDAVNVFLEVRYQLIMGSSGPIDLNHLAIEAAIRRKGLQDPACFGKVIILGRWWLQRLIDKQ